VRNDLNQAQVRTDHVVVVTVLNAGENAALGRQNVVLAVVPVPVERPWHRIASTNQKPISMSTKKNTACDGCGAKQSRNVMEMVKIKPKSRYSDAAIDMTNMYENAASERGEHARRKRRRRWHACT